MTRQGQRWVLIAIGWMFVGLGLIGVILPVLPTTPFMLLALWCFARSSQRFHDWLYHHPVFGPPLQLWHHHRVIPLGGKIIALTAMAGSLTYLVFFRETAGWIVVVAALVMGYGAWFILTKPSRPPLVAAGEAAPGRVNRADREV